MCSSCSSATDWPGRISGASARGLAGFIDPRHLDCFEYLLAAAAVVVVKPLEVDHPVVQVDKAHGQRVDLGMQVVQGFGDGGDVTPFHGVLRSMRLFSGVVDGVLGDLDNEVFA